MLNVWPLAEALGRIALILVLAWLLLRLLHKVTPKLVALIVARELRDSHEEEIVKRVETLRGILTTILALIITLVAAFTLLAELGVNIVPALAGLSLIGVAVGFGAQSFIKDVIAGFFILVENQYAKGDVVKVAGVSGMVEEINLRRTLLRDQDGALHTVPNGEIKIATNLTRSWSRVNLDVTVAYDTDLEQAIELLNRLGAELAADETYSAMITEAPKVKRVESLGDTGVVLKVLGVTRPAQQWDVAGELRRRILREFAIAGIEIPFPGRMLLPQPRSDTSVTRRS
ncbi:MAG: mechanosensitive ion channel family protein [Chloroflexi bacterium]|nr:mechanosensitive ion channel family protein [Chloroflexota bacterium]